MNTPVTHWFKFASPQNFYHLAGKLWPWFAARRPARPGLPHHLCACAGLADVDVHLPGDGCLGGDWAGVQHPVVGHGGLGSGPHRRPVRVFVGKPMWGAWWVWDARLTSTLILLFLYLGFMALHASIDDPRRADRASAVLALVGAVNVPIIYFSVKWWNTLHQGASVSLKGSSMASTMLTGMLVMVVAFWMYAIAMALFRVRNIILDRERHTEWVKHAVA